MQPVKVIPSGLRKGLRLFCSLMCPFGKGDDDHLREEVIKSHQRERPSKSGWPFSYLAEGRG